MELIGLTAFVGVFYAIGFGLLGYGLWGAWQSVRAANWPTAPAALSNLKMDERPDDGGCIYEVQVQYAYRVNDVPYEGSRIAFGYTASGGREPHEEILRTLKNAKSISVRYDPRDPSVSCLSHGIHRSIQITLAFAIAWLCFIGGMSYHLWVFACRDTTLVNNLLVK